MTYYTKADEAAEAFFRAQATAEGLTYAVWCKKYGIIGPAALHRIADNEVSRDGWIDHGLTAYSNKAGGRYRGARFVSSKEWTGAYKSHPRGVTSTKTAKSSAARRRLTHDAAEAAD